MAITGIVTAAFQSKAAANNDVRQALTGTIKAGDAEAPFVKRNTGVYSCADADVAVVAQALIDLAQALLKHSAELDTVTVALTRTDVEL